MELAFWAAIGYLFGSFPTGYLAVKIIKGEDIRTLGSGNTGGTNVGRVMGKKWAVSVTLVDMLKGGAVVMLCRAFGGGDATVALAAFAAVRAQLSRLAWFSRRQGRGHDAGHAVFRAGMGVMCGGAAGRRALVFDHESDALRFRGFVGGAAVCRRSFWLFRASPRFRDACAIAGGAVAVASSRQLEALGRRHGK